jgi:hypothetical protein
MTTRIVFLSIFLANSFLFNAQLEFSNQDVTYKKGSYLGVSIPISDLPAVDENEAPIHNEGTIKQNRIRPEAVNPDALPLKDDPIRQSSFGKTSTKSAIQNWDGQIGAFPPDPTGAAGPNHYVQAVNSRFRVYSKTGSPMSTSKNLNTLWAGSTSDGDPIVLYDRHADRWVITQFQISGNKILLAVSTTPDPLGTFHTYSFSFSQFPDYPKFSIWSDGYYMTSNSGSMNAVAFEREKMLVGDPTAAMVALNLPPMSTGYGFRSVLPADADGDLPPYGTPNYMFFFQDDSWGGISTDQIRILKMNVNWAAPNSSTISLHQTLFPSPFNSVFTNSWNDITQKNSQQKIDAIASVFNYRAQYMRWSGFNSVVLCNVVDIDNNNTGGIRWYELRQDEATQQFSIFQEGTFAPSDGDSRFIGSIAMDNQKNIGLAYSISGVNSFPSLGFTGRYSWHAPGQMTLQEQRAVEGVSAQSGGNRFGDYSHMTLDPDGKTFWFTGEYIGSGGSRKTRIFSFSMQDMLGAEQNKLEMANLKAFVSESFLQISLTGYSEEDEFQVELFEMNGRTVHSSKKNTVNGTLNHAIHVAELPSATYLIRIGNSSVQRVQKIMIP